MASPDHTARAYPSDRNDSDAASTTSSGDALTARSPEQEQRLTLTSTQASIAIAALCIDGILSASNDYLQNHSSGERAGLLPLNTVQVNGLKAAIHFLHQYHDALTAEHAG